MEKTTFVIGFYFAIGGQRTVVLDAVIKNLETGDEFREPLAYDSWTRRNPETLSERASIINGLCELNKPISHRTLSWVKKKSFKSAELAIEWAKITFSEAEKKYKERELKNLEKEILG